MDALKAAVSEFAAEEEALAESGLRSVRACLRKRILR